MGLIARIRHQVGYVAWWRLKHWWLDTPRGRASRYALYGAAALAACVQLARVALAAFTPPASGQPRQAIVWMVVWLIVSMLVGLALALTAKQPKPQAAPDNTQPPTTQDGQNAKHHFGTCRVDDTFLLAWKLTGRDPIQTKGGGKK